MFSYRVAAFSFLWWGIFGGGVGHSQGTVDLLENALKDTKLKHEQTVLDNQKVFAEKIEMAVRSAGDAKAFYLESGGSVPAGRQEPPPRHMDDRDRKRWEKDQEAKAAEEAANAGVLLWRYCQLYRFAYLFATMQSGPDGNAAWTGWLEQVAGEYPTLYGSFVGKIKVSEDPITESYRLGKVWGGKPQAGWNLQMLSGLYRQYVLDSFREDKNPEIGKAWDTYIAMRNVEVKSDIKWDMEERPWLLFQKQADLCRIAPSDTQLTRLIDIIRESPDNPKFEEMHKVASELLAGLKQKKAAAAAKPAAPAVQ